MEACKPSDKGCTDPKANNLDADASINDGSCTYDDVLMKPLRSIELSMDLIESSGLISWNGSLWTHNDNSDTRLYALDTTQGNIVEEIVLEGVENINWEDIDQDADYIYVGDFGNNLSGNRQDLRILRIHKQQLLLGEPQIDSIHFSYSDQDNFDPAGPNQTEYDCEAMISWGEHIFLFTKQWISGETSLYSLPKTPGSHEAVKQNSYLVNGLVSGAAAIESKGLVVLCGYDKLLQPFLLLLYDFKAPDFFSGNIRKIQMNLPFHQVEGIAATEELTFYLSNESYTLPSQTTFPQKLHRLDLSPFLE
jgi:hypothetical protein